MIFYLNLVMLMVVLGRVDAKKKSNPIINNYNTYNYNNNSCTGTTCNFGNVTNINNNNNITNNQNNITDINNQNNITNNQNNITNNQNNITDINNYSNITNVFNNDTDQPPCYNAWNSSVAFSAYLYGDLTAGSQHRQIPFDNVMLNHGDAFDKTNGTFKAPVKGGYSFSISVRAQHGHNNWARAWIEVEKPDGRKGYYAGTRADNWVISSNTVNVELDKGDTVSVYLYAGYKMFGSGWTKDTTFSGHLLYLA